jgi:hypothetical protein
VPTFQNPSKLEYNNNLSSASNVKTPFESIIKNNNLLNGSYKMGNMQSLASNNFTKELNMMRGNKNNIDTEYNNKLYNDSLKAICVVSKNRKKPRCKLKKSVTILKRPNRTGKIISIKKVCRSR